MIQEVIPQQKLLAVIVVEEGVNQNCQTVLIIQVIECHWRKKDSVLGLTLKT